MIFRPVQHNDDEYANLMSQREREWIINIQVNQLKDERDYYYTVYMQKKKAEAEGIDLQKGRRHFFGEENDESVNEGGGYNRRDEETALLLKSESALVDSPKDEYTPRQFEKSLGKLQAINVKAPRKIIDLGAVDADLDSSTTSAQKDSRYAEHIEKSIWSFSKLFSKNFQKLQEDSDGA